MLEKQNKVHGVQQAEYKPGDPFEFIVSHRLRPIRGPAYERMFAIVTAQSDTDFTVITRDCKQVSLVLESHFNIIERHLQIKENIKQEYTNKRPKQTIFNV